ncbi:hypothetical protein EYF80_032017 [Liparis tanakae]|uniref:Uncharacterized protein n=1 Tax=Liparis tanakae TaxID=230148 RepID=A0A4Z2GWA4_9TELE|nr:hypothetical protein EYF80_032017 [Liparis tanakae]
MKEESVGMELTETKESGASETERGETTRKRSKSSASPLAHRGCSPVGPMAVREGEESSSENCDAAVRREQQMMTQSH